MCANSDQYESVCRGEFQGISDEIQNLGNQMTALHGKMDHIDESIRGNGKPGLNQRVAINEERLRVLHNGVKPPPEPSVRDEVSVLGGKVLSVKGKAAVAATTSILAHLSRFAAVLLLALIAYLMLEQRGLVPSILPSRGVSCAISTDARTTSTITPNAIISP